MGEIAINPGAIDALNDQFENMCISENVTFGNISAGSSLTIQIDWSKKIPNIVQVRDSVGGRPIIVTNWWVSNGKLNMQLFNATSSQITGATVPFHFIVGT